MLNLFMVTLFAIGYMECFMTEIISYTEHDGFYSWGFVNADDGIKFQEQRFYIWAGNYAIRILENPIKFTYFSPFIIKQVNGQEIHQFVDIRDKGYQADDNLKTKFGKLYFTSNDSYLGQSNDHGGKGPKCFTGAVFISGVIDKKCHFLIQFDRIQKAEDLFDNPILIQAYSDEFSFVNDDHHLYVLVEVESANFETILEKFDLSVDYNSNDGYRNNLIPKKNETIAKFKITNGEIKISTGIDKPEDDTAIDKAENDTAIDKAENDTGINKAQIAAIVVSCVVVVIAIAIGVIFLVRSNKAKGQSSASVNRNQIHVNETNNQVRNLYQGNIYQENLYQANNSVFHVNQGQSNEAEYKTGPRYE